MSSTPVVGSAFVEVHARAAANLEGEMRVETERAANRVQARLPPVASAGSQSVRRAEDKFGAGSKEALAAQQAFEERGAAFSARIADQRAKAIEDADKTVRKTVADTADNIEQANQRVSASTARTASGLLQGASAYLLVDTAVRALTGTVGAFIAAGDEGRLKSAADLRAYRELANGLDELGDEFDRVKLRIGSFIATDINPFSSKFEKGVEALKNPLDTLAVFMGRTTNGTRDLAAAFTEIDKNDPSDTLAEIARRTKEVDEAVADAQKQYDARADATVRAVAAEFELGQASERLWNAQVRVNQASSQGAEIARRLADAERSVREAREAASDAAQDAIEADRRLAERRRVLAETSFRTGSQSQATRDAADAVQEAEFDATRAHQEAGDAVADVAKAERDAADVRVKSAEDQTRALEDLHEAQREVAARTADVRAAQQEASGATVTATDRLRIYGEELGKFADAGGPKLRAELDRIKTALETLGPLLAPWVSPELDAILNQRATSAAQAYAARAAGGGAPPGPGPAPAPLPAGAQRINLGPGLGSVTVYNVYNTPVDPAQVAREQAAQITGGGSAPRVI